MGAHILDSSPTGWAPWAPFPPPTEQKKKRELARASGGIIDVFRDVFSPLSFCALCVGSLRAPADSYFPSVTFTPKSFTRQWEDQEFCVNGNVDRSCEPLGR